MYSCDILPIPKYAKQLNLSSLAASANDEQSSSRIRKPNQKFKLLSLHTIKKDDAKNFYHHSSIYNIKEYKDLTKSPVFFQDNTNQKLSDLQTKVLVTDFQRKVAAYLLKTKDTKNVKKYYSDLKGRECETQQSIQYHQEMLNRSLCLNKYNYKPEQKSEIGIEVMLMDNNKLVAKQVIPNERLQSRLLKFMEQFLNDDHIDYDHKMQLMTQQYKEVVKKIKTKAFKVKVPQNYSVQMSDYNDYYQVTERQKRDIYEQQFDSLADQIIQSLQQSESLSSQKNSLTDLQEPIQTQPDVSQIQMQEEQPDEEQDDQVVEMKKSKISNKQKDSKKLTKKNSVRQLRPSVIQRQNSELAQQNTEQQQQNSQQQHQQSRSTLDHIQPIHEEEVIQTIQELAQELKKPAKKHMTKAQREEQKKRKKEIQQLHEHIEKVKKEKGGDFEYEKSDSDSEERFRRQKMQNYDDMFKPKQISRRQSDQFNSEENDHDFASEHEMDDNKKERVEQIISQKKDPNFQYNPQEFWQQEVKINRKKPQLPLIPSQQKQQEMFQQFQKEQLQKQLESIQEKYSSKQDNSQTQQQQQQPTTYQQQQQQNQQQYQQQQSHQQSTNKSPQQQYLKQPHQDNKQTQFSIQQSFKTPQKPANQQDQSQEHSFNGEQKQPQQFQSSNVTSQQQLNNSQMSGIQSSKQLDKQETVKQKQSKSNNKKNQDVPEIKVEPVDEGAEISKKIEEKLLQVQQNLSRAKLGIIEKLLAAQSVYDVELQEFKLADFPLSKTIFPKLNGEDEKQIFQQLFSWQKEIHQIIPIMNQLNRNLKVPDEDEGAASQLVSSDDENN